MSSAFLVVVTACARGADAPDATDLALEYFFTDTGKELPEVYDFLGRLEGFLGAPIHRLNPDRDFDFWLREYNNFLPSPRTRWCTRQLKLRPFERWIRPDLEAGATIYSYVAIRADEPHREGLTATSSQPEGRVAAPRTWHRQGWRHRSARWRWRSSPRLLPLAVAQRLHLLFLSAENRMGEPHEGASLKPSQKPSVTKKTRLSTARRSLGVTANPSMSLPNRNVSNRLSVSTKYGSTVSRRAGGRTR